MKQKSNIKKKQSDYYYCLFIVVIDRNALSHCCLSYISRACNNIDVLRLLLLSIDDDEEQRNTFRAKSKENINLFTFIVKTNQVLIQLMYVKNFQMIIQVF